MDKSLHYVIIMLMPLATSQLARAGLETILDHSEKAVNLFHGKKKSLLVKRKCSGRSKTLGLGDSLQETVLRL